MSEDVYTPVIIRDTLTRFKRKRIWELDFFRGVCILLMCMDHTVFNFAATFAAHWKASGNDNLVALVNLAVEYWKHPARLAVQEAVLWTFFSLCGMSVALTRNTFLHSAKIILAAGIISAVTLTLVQFNMLNKGDAIRFGVLHMLGAVSLIVAVIYTFTRKNKWVNFGVFLSLALIVLLVDALYLDRVELHKETVWLSMFHENLGHITQFSPGDCFPLIPHAAKVFVGAALGPLLYGKKKTLLPSFEGSWYRPVNFIGRHTIWVVLIHQPIIIGIIALINYLFLTPGSSGVF